MSFWDWLVTTLALTAGIAFYLILWSLTAIACVVILGTVINILGTIGCSIMLGLFALVGTAVYLAGR